MKYILLISMLFGCSESTWYLLMRHTDEDHSTQRVEFFAYSEECEAAASKLNQLGSMAQYVCIKQTQSNGFR